jgi:hypothetical protein
MKQMSQLRRRLSAILAVGALMLSMTATVWADTIQVDGDIATAGQGNSQACLTAGTGDTITANLLLKYNGNDHFIDGTVTITPALDGGRGSSFITAAGGTLTLSAWSAGDEVNTDLTITIANDWAAKSATDAGPYKILYTLTQVGNSYVADNSSNMNAIIINGDGCTTGGGGGGTIDYPPTVDAGGPYSGAEGSAIPLNGASASDDLSTPTLSWSYTAGADVDLGAVCAFSSATVLHPTFTCDDDGTFTVTLSANDGVNAAATDSATVNVSNANPTTSNAQFTLNAITGTASASFSFADQGTHDSHTASFMWSGIDTAARAGLVTETLGAGTASDSRKLGPGCYTLTLTASVTDDDLGSASAPAFTGANGLQIDVPNVRFLPPIKDSERNIAKYGNVVPVKVELDSSCNPGTTITNVSLFLTYVQGADPEDTQLGSEPVAESVSNADSGSQMRLADGFYIYNFTTKPLQAGKDYTLKVRLGSTSGPLLIDGVLQPKK